MKHIINKISLLAASLILLIGGGCSDDDTVDVNGLLSDPVVERIESTSVSKYTVNVTSNIQTGGHKITDRGFCYNTTGMPTIADTRVSIEEDVTALAKTLTNLESLTTYYVRAYATTEAGNTYYSPNEVSFLTDFYQQTSINLNTVSAKARTITVNGYVASDSSNPIIECGMIVSPTNNPEAPEAQTIPAASPVQGTMIMEAGGVEPDTDYYVWVYLETQADGRIISSAKSVRTQELVGISGPSMVGSLIRIGCYHISLNMAINELGNNATITEAGILWSKTQNIDPEAAGVNKRVDKRITTVGAYDICFTGMETATTYYFLPYVTTSNGKTFYGKERSYSTRTDWDLWNDSFNFLSANRKRYVNCYPSMTTVTTTQRDFMTRFTEAFAADNYRFEKSGSNGQMVFIMGMRDADSLLVLQWDFTPVEVTDLNNQYYRARFGWKASLNHSTSIATFTDMVYMPENFPTVTSNRMVEAAQWIMNGEHTGPVTKEFFKWLFGTAEKPNPILIDFYHSTANPSSGGGYYCFMPLNEETNPDYDCIRLNTGSWGGPALPVWK